MSEVIITCPSGNVVTVHEELARAFITEDAQRQQDEAVTFDDTRSGAQVLLATTAAGRTYTAHRARTVTYQAQQTSVSYGEVSVTLPEDTSPEAFLAAAQLDLEQGHVIWRNEDVQEESLVRAPEGAVLVLEGPGHRSEHPPYSDASELITQRAPRALLSFPDTGPLVTGQTPEGPWQVTLLSPDTNGAADQEWEVAVQAEYRMNVTVTVRARSAFEAELRAATQSDPYDIISEAVNHDHGVARINLHDSEATTTES